jgi:hypothetical protein
MAVTFTTTILQFAQMAEKTGWTYIEIPADIAQQLKPNNKKTFRVKGKLDSFPIKSVAVMPRGDGSFILAVNAEMRKGIGKRKGAIVNVQLQEDKATIPINAELLECLKDDPDAEAHFNSLNNSHKSYFSKYIDNAKTEPTKTKRLTQTLLALGKGWDYGRMIREGKQNKEDW